MILLGDSTVIDMRLEGAEILSYPPMSLAEFLSNFNDLFQQETSQTYVISFGTNDSCTIDEYCEMLIELSKRLQTKRTLLVIARKFSTFEEHLEELAHRLPDNVDLLDFFNGDESDIELLESDLVHLNDRGKQELAEFIIENS